MVNKILPTPCVECFYCKPGHNSSSGDRCFHPKVVATDSWALAYNKRGQSNGALCNEERQKRSQTAPCGMKGKLWKQVNKNLLDIKVQQQSKHQQVLSKPDKFKKDSPIAPRLTPKTVTITANQQRNAFTIATEVTHCSRELQQEQSRVYNPSVEDIQKILTSIGFSSHNNSDPKRSATVSDEIFLPLNRPSRRGSTSPNIPSRERLVSEPAAWSILSCTLPEVFSISTPYADPSIEDSPVTIGSLGFSAEDIAQLRRVVLFPEEPADYLLSCTLGYLMQVDLSEDALSILLDHLLHISGFSGRTQKSDIAETVSVRAIYSDIQISQIDEFHVYPFLYTDIIDASDKAAVITWGKIATITERSIIKRIGFTIRGLKIIQYLWQLKDRALKLERGLSQDLPSAAYADFDRLVEALLLRRSDKCPPCRSDKVPPPFTVSYAQLN